MRFVGSQFPAQLYRVGASSDILIRLPLPLIKAEQQKSQGRPGSALPHPPTKGSVTGVLRFSRPSASEKPITRRKEKERREVASCYLRMYADSGHPLKALPRALAVWSHRRSKKATSGSNRCFGHSISSLDARLAASLCFLSCWQGGFGRELTYYWI